MNLLSPLKQVFLSTILLLSASSALAQDTLTQKNGVGRIVFTKITDSGKDISVANLKTGEITTLFASSKDDSSPSWSKDGKWVLFQSDICGNNDIFEIRTDAQIINRITSDLNSEQDPAWSPDNQKIVFRKVNFNQKSSSISIINRDGSGEFSIPKLSRKNTFPRWSPKGDEIIFSSNQNWPGWDLVIYSLSDKKLTNLTFGSNSYVKPSWRPDGNALIFSYGSLNKASIWGFAKGDTTSLEIIKREGRNLDAEFSLDGKNIFFSGESSPESGIYLLHSFNLESKTIDALTTMNNEFSARNPNWTPLPEFPFHLDNENKEIQEQKDSFSAPSQAQIEEICAS